MLCYCSYTYYVKKLCMAVARSNQIDLSATPYYHCISRCVRRSYLYGKDPLTGKDYSYRKYWLVNRLKRMVKFFAIDICAYAVMSNHYHVVFHVNKELAKSWTAKEVFQRWGNVFPNDAAKYRSILDSNNGNYNVIEKQIELWRKRLYDISWFMRTINENIARKCNVEDECTGRFWEGRFKSQALCDSGALLSAMAYVDLNPVRAGIAKTPELSDFTSIQERINKVKNYCKNQQEIDIQQACSKAPQPIDLMKFKNKISSKTTKKIKKENHKNNTEKNKPTIDFTFEDYLKLVDETGRIIRQDKKGAISNSLKPILARLGMSSSGWLKMANGVEKNFSYAVGMPGNIAKFGNNDVIRVRKGVGYSKNCYLKDTA